MTRAIAAGLGLAALAASAAAEDGARRNAFDDPFVQATRGLQHCPVAAGPLVTAAEARSQAHVRIERGTSCYQEGRCRLPNAYLYDREIVPRAVQLLRSDPRFARSTVWVLGQRRWVFLQGCVSTSAQAKAIARKARSVPDVERVVDQLMVGTRRTPPYETTP